MTEGAWTFTLVIWTSGTAWTSIVDWSLMKVLTNQSSSLQRYYVNLLWDSDGGLKAEQMGSSWESVSYEVRFGWCGGPEHRCTAWSSLEVFLASYIVCSVLSSCANTTKPKNRRRSALAVFLFFLVNPELKDFDIKPSKWELRRVVPKNNILPPAFFMLGYQAGKICYRLACVSW